MTAVIDIHDLSKRLDMPIVERLWMDYPLGIGRGSRRGRNYAYDTTGNVVNFQDSYKRMRGVFNYLLKNDFESCTSFWVGFLVFCLKQKRELIQYDDNSELTIDVTLKPCCESFVFPGWCREKLEKILDMRFSFPKFIKAAHKLKGTCFNLQSALDVYRLQGDKACLGIMSQMFWNGSRGEEFNVVLVPGVDMKFTPKVSNYLSGVVFPCVVSPFCKDLHWEETNDGIFLFGNDLVYDCCQVGFYSLWDTPLGNRLFFSGRGGVSKNIVCYCWGDIIKAVGVFGEDVLVRSLGENLFNADWHRFGLDGLVAVTYVRRRIYGRNSTFDGFMKPYFSFKTDKKRESFVMNLRGERVRKCQEESVIYSTMELKDWFELGELCKEELK